MAKVSNKTIAAVFAAAILELQIFKKNKEADDYYGKQKFICRAICSATGDYLWDAPIQRSCKTNAALKVIRDRMGGFGRQSGTLEEWLVAMGIPKRKLTPKKMQDYRLAWLKALVAEFSQNS